MSDNLPPDCPPSAIDDATRQHECAFECEACGGTSDMDCIRFRDCDFCTRDGLCDAQDRRAADDEGDRASDAAREAAL
jgi:hypothetical protein